MDPCVYVVENDTYLRGWIGKALVKAGLEVFSYPTAHEFLECCDLQRPACVLIDCQIQGLSAQELLRLLVDRRSVIVPVVIAANVEIAEVVAAMKMGAADYLEKPFATENLLQVVHDAIAQSSKRWLVESSRRNAESQINSLSTRERQVMNLLATGRHTKAIAKELGLSPKTVEHHRPKIFSKLGVENVVELTHLVLMSRDTTYRIHRPEYVPAPVGASGLLNQELASSLPQE